MNRSVSNSGCCHDVGAAPTASVQRYLSAHFAPYSLSHLKGLQRLLLIVATTKEGVSNFRAAVLGAIPAVSGNSTAC